jgi:hypothetical protein
MSYVILSAINMSFPSEARNLGSAFLCASVVKSFMSPSKTSHSNTYLPNRTKQ